LLGLVFAAACGDATGPQASVTVTVKAQGGPSYPKDSAGTQLIQCDVLLKARNGGTQRAGWMDATFAFYAPNDSQTPFFTDTAPAATVRTSWGADSIPPGVDQTAGWVVYATIPFTVKMRFAYGSAHEPDGATQVSVSCKPPTPSGPPPTITNLQAQPDTAAEPSDTLHVSYGVTTTVGLWETLVEVSGPCDIGVLVPERLQTTVTHDVGVPLPAACGLGVPVRVTVTAFDIGLQETSRSLTLPALVDHRPPRLSVMASMLYSTWPSSLESFAGYVFTGDDLTVLVNATDNHALHGVYWEVLPAGVRDSMLANDSALSQPFTIRARAGWSGAIQLRLYAKDALGHVSDTVSSVPGNIQVGPTVGPSPTLTSVPGDITDVAFDAKRGVIYLLQSNSEQITVFSPTSLTVLRSITLPDYAPDFDLSPSGDSIVTVLKNSQAIGIVDLTQASPALRLVPLALDTSYKLLNIRVASNGRALIATQNVSLDSGGVKRLYTYDLASGTLHVRLDAPALGYEASGQLERSGDGRVFVVNGEAGAFVRYDAAADVFGNALTARIPDRRPSLDSTGADVAVAGDVYDAALQHLFTVGVARSGAGAAAVSPDGQTHYMALAPTYVQGIYTSPGIVRSHMSDGSMIDRIPLIMLTTLLRVSPDGSTIAAVESYNYGPARLSLINLSQLH